MGYLNKATITVDAILTNRGRQILADQGRAGIQIAKFALADDEIDYGLYNLNEFDGEFGSIIENMPLLEATPDEQQIMRYKLVTLDNTTDPTGFGTVFYQGAGQVIIPRITGIRATAYTLSERGNPEIRLSPQTTPVRTATATSGFSSEPYTYLIGNARLFDIYKGTGTGAQNAVAAGNLLNGTVNANGSLTISKDSPTATSGVRFAGTEGITLKWKSGYGGKSTQITIFGDLTGATISQTINVSSDPNAT